MLTNKRIFITFSFLLFLTNTGFGQTISYNFDVSSYDIFYEIDAEKRIFKSVQDIFIKNASTDALDRMNFLLHPELFIDDIAVENLQGKNLSIKSWKTVGVTKVFKNELQIVEVQTQKTIAPGQQCKFHLEYHMLSESFENSSQIPDNTLELVISPKVSYAIGPKTGHNAIFNRNIIAPFQIRIKYPDGNLCCVPGTLLSSAKVEDRIIETYHSKIPNIPTFSCAIYEKTVRKIGDITFEYYLYPGQSFVEQMATMPAQFVQLYTSSFGDIGTDTYRFGNIGAPDSRLLSLENKGNAIYLADLLTRYYSMDDGVKDMFNGLIAHELFHNWNIFAINWVGQLTDWFEEGGANFIASWASEKVISEDFGISGRIHFTSAYAGDQGTPGYNANGTLASVSKENSEDPELMLIYYYGALVWEQLRQKIGDESLFAGLGDFFKKYRFETVTYKDFLQCLQAKTSVNIEEYLNQWIKHNAIIDLSISNVSIQQKDDFYSTYVEILVDSNRDYELLTAIGYKTSPEGEMEMIDLHTMKKGVHKIRFQSKKEPVFIQIDPGCRVPQINLDNNIWSQ